MTGYKVYLLCRCLYCDDLHFGSYGWEGKGRVWVEKMSLCFLLRHNHCNFKLFVIFSMITDDKVTNDLVKMAHQALMIFFFFFFSPLLFRWRCGRNGDNQFCKGHGANISCETWCGCGGCCHCVVGGGMDQALLDNLQDGMHDVIDKIISSR